jgi:hypothetical protein
MRQLFSFLIPHIPITAAIIKVPQDVVKKAKIIFLA